VDTASKSMRLLGLDEAEIAGPIRHMARAARSAIDAGASDGWYTLYFATRPNIEIVHAYEPDPACHTTFQANLELNQSRLHSKVRLHPEPFGNQDPVAGATFDRDLSTLPEPILIKADVEGAELDLLRAARETLCRHRVLLVVETHSADIESECLRLLGACGYRCRIISQAWYRRCIPESRPLPHNRWIVAERGHGGRRTERERARPA
jgi:hypothetical protein